MKLSPNDLKAKYFAFAYTYNMTFWRNWPTDPPSKTNLCQFMRHMLIWFPLTIACQLGTLYAIIYALVLYPLKRMGSTFWLPAVWLVVVAIAVCAVVALIGCIGYLYEKHKRQKELALREELQREREEKGLEYWEDPYWEVQRKKRERFKKTMLGMILAWFVAAKKKICPLIEIGK